MATVTGSSVSQRVQKRYRPELPLITCGKCGQKIVMEYKVSKEGVNKGHLDALKICHLDALDKSLVTCVSL